MNVLHGHHHLTLCVGGAQEDYTFHSDLLGLKSVKKTILYDGKAPIYHLYYGNENGDPSTLITTFSFRHTGLKGERGTGQVRTIACSIPESALSFWKKRLEAHGYQVEELERFGENRLRFYHPCGIEYELVGSKNDPRKPRGTDEIPEDKAIRGVHSVTVSVRSIKESAKFMNLAMGFEQTRDDRAGEYHRFEVNGGGPGKTVEFIVEADRDQGSWFYGEGIVHHVAFKVNDKDVQKEYKDYLEGLGFTDVSESKDRGYFHSIYFRTPGGALFEAAYSVPEGFCVDEPRDQLGHSFILPAFVDDKRRAEIMDQLEKITY
ncbi:MAG: VOC family protein [Gammaproteobacteria bacterium]|nr:VOC family protein [Gammaproteobacteria bacterium]